MTLQQRQEDFISVFNDLFDWKDRFDYLVLIGDELPPMPGHLRVPVNCLQGCISQTYFSASYVNDRLQIEGYSNAAIPAGIIAVIREIFQGCTRQELYDCKIDFHFRTDLIHHLTPARSGILLQMLYKII